MTRSLSIIAITASLASPLWADAPVGFDRFDIQADHRAAPIAAGIWSPVGRETYVARIGDNPVFVGVDAYIGAALPDQEMPLIVLSHGSGSSIDGTAWLAAGLAERGAMVVVLNHPGTTSGDSSPRRTVRLSERAADLSAALDHVLADPYFADRIDQDRIAALGFSLGGSTVLGIAGIQLDPVSYADYCDTFGEAAQDCLFLARGGVDFDRLPAEFSADMTDDRFARVVAVDPGFTYAATPESAAEVAVPVQLVTLGDTFPWAAVDVRSEGSGLVDTLPQVDHAVIPDAHHFSFLPICTDIAPMLLIEEGEDPICDDPEGWDRAQVHRASLDAIAAFLDL
ncbi:alpha/beta fold hydrolase [Yoonia sp. F2084L]|uniref:alpha/beta hydrolase family protein n=1 Tax=Yoonia sp. F2084L TaxID=2926419 RepID=UPI001FF6AF88|nr:alpha/beta fold hydrolase [Yoonia sp. F2084L]MCK0097456.1 alpha/beta fold hydrolase [Yoonia sp. F2084L]